MARCTRIGIRKDELIVSVRLLYVVLLCMWKRDHYANGCDWPFADEFGRLSFICLLCFDCRNGYLNHRGMLGKEPEMNFMELFLGLMVYFTEVKPVDEEYLKNVSALDDTQLEPLLLAYWDDVRNYIYLMTRNHDSVDDLTQDTFIRAFRSLHSFRGESSFKTWLITIARNVTHSYQRSAWIRKIVLMDQLVTGGSSPSAESQFFRSATQEYVWNKVFQLPVKLRDVLILDAKYELSIREIATVLGIPEGTVKSRLNRARSKMSKLLEGGVISGYRET